MAARLSAFLFLTRSRNIRGSYLVRSHTVRFSLRPLIARLAIAIAFPVAAFVMLSFMTISVRDAHAQQMPQGAKQPGEFPRAKLTAGMYVIDAAVAANDADREQGLMYRSELAPNEGMLFVFGENAVHCFWMKNTLIPLSIAFMRADGTVTDIDEMQAETTNNHCPKNNGVYALEMSKGWFTSKGIKPGMKIQGLPAPQ
jgi:uncharacterized protein